MSLRVVKLSAENYKRLVAIEIVPGAEPVVTIAGKNAAGKTSVLDAIWAALTGREAVVDKPIRDGEDHAVVTLDLGEYVVERRWTKDDAGTLTVKAHDGAKYSSPQKLLDEIVGKRAFDPLAFTRQSVKEQVATLVSTVELPFDPDVLERERKGVFDSRTEVGREVTKLEGQLKGYPLPDPSLPEVEVSAADLLAEVEAARRQAACIEDARRWVELADVDVERSEANLANARRALKSAELELADARAYAAERRTALDALPAAADTAAIGERLSSLEQTNARIRQEQHRKAVAAELSDRKAEVARFTLKLREIEKRKADALAAVEFPVPGLSFDETGVLFNGIPFSQASAAEQLRVSVALAMAANPTLRVLRILDGSLLDSDSLEIIRELAVENAYQVWVERVDETGEIGFVIEDGQVRS